MNKSPTFHHWPRNKCSKALRVGCIGKYHICLHLYNRIHSGWVKILFVSEIKWQTCDLSGRAVGENSSNSTTKRSLYSANSTNWELYMVGLLLNYKAKRLFSQLGRLKLLYTPKITVLYWHLWFHDFLTSMETINRTVHKNVFKVEKLSLD